MEQAKQVKMASSAPAVKVPPSGRKPIGNLAPRDVAKVAEELVAYHDQFADLYKRREQRQWAEFYLQGQLSDLERKTVEPMVLALKGRDANAIRAVQQFLGEGTWEDQAMLERREKLVAQDIGEPDGVLICDGSGFPKKGEYSVGVARQYCGALGKIANSQQGVFVVYVSSRGHTFVDRRLYLPQVWFSEAYAEKRKRCGVPLDLEFHTEPELALAMVSGVVERKQLPFQWVAADEHYGMNPAFLDGLNKRGRWYFAEVPKNTMVWPEAVEIMAPGKGPLGAPRKGPVVAPGTPKAQAVEQIGAEVSDAAWRRHTIKEGSRGPITADFAFVRATAKRGRRPGHAVWIIFRRGLEPGAEIKYYLSNAPADCARTTLVRISGLRWPVETALEEAKSELGMDHYETRTWRGWHHQMTLTFLAHHFLLRLRLKLEKKVQR
ncbi:MAG: IS701 family transposase [Pyrinomonadaceae bacterium]|nr:IS701 family transposase [Pyrinomonadaceae bacterium]